MPALDTQNARAEGIMPAQEAGIRAKEHSKNLRHGHSKKLKLASAAECHQIRVPLARSAKKLECPRKSPLRSSSSAMVSVSGAECHQTRVPAGESP